MDRSVLARSKMESDGEKQKRDMQDLRLKSDAQLLELLERQTRILYQKGLVAKLADKGERVQNLKSRIEQELAARKEMSKLSGAFTQVKLTDNMEWNVAAGEDRLKPRETSSDPLLNFLQLKAVDPYVENICNKYGTMRQGDDAPDRFIPHRSNVAPIKAGKSAGMKSPKQQEATEHGVQEISIKDSLSLQQTQAQTSVPKSGNQLTAWRQIATAIDSEGSEDELEDQQTEEEIESKAEDQEDPPELPDN